jgi:hypothetical protein
MKMLGLGLAAAVSALTMAAPAQSAVLMFQTGDVYSGTFGRSQIAKTPSFTDTLSFTLADSKWLFNSSLTSTATAIGGRGDIDFISVILTGGTISPEAFSIDNGGFVSVASLVAPILLGAGDYTLTITAQSFGGAQYSGNTTATNAVPEAATWAMMLVGFGAVGSVLRSRRPARSLAAF